MISAPHFDNLSREKGKEVECKRRWIFISSAWSKTKTKEGK